ncbi:MAG: endolytic transglycosylase MltG [Acidobacteria bacterium]|nr:endolytic transglycosylase MltG [Acidobacteriota bacterium]
MRTLFKLLLLALLATGVWLAWMLFVPYGPTTEKLVLLRPGSSTRQIAVDLYSAGVVRSVPSFLLLHYARGERALKAGEYRFDHPATALEVYDRLARGDVVTHTVVIPEGFNVFEIASAIESAGLATRRQFLNVAQSETALISDLDPGAASLEGYLFPDTYEFSRVQSPRDLAAAMVRRFRQEAHALGISSDARRVVTLASIVEKETSVPEERTLVAGVYTNRLRKNMTLAADPTVVYAAQLAGRYRGAIYKSDLEFDSPYNTYRHAGLPPGPIANPGRAALQASLRPAATDYYYFVSDNHGAHRFARTAQEHARNVAAYRRSVTPTKP